MGSDEEHVAVTDALSDIPLGICTDEATGAEEEINIAILGLQTSSQLLVAGEAIGAGDMLITGTDGKARILPTSAGTYYIIGRALETAATDEQFEAATCFPQQRVVT